MEHKEQETTVSATNAKVQEEMAALDQTTANEKEPSEQTTEKAEKETSLKKQEEQIFEKEDGEITESEEEKTSQEEDEETEDKQQNIRTEQLLTDKEDGDDEKSTDIEGDDEKPTDFEKKKSTEEEKIKETEETEKKELKSSLSSRSYITASLRGGARALFPFFLFFLISLSISISVLNMFQ